jgi:type II secretory pathway component PulC
VPAPRPGATARATASSTPPAASDEDAAAAVDRERPDWSTPEEALQDLAQQAVFVPELGEGGRVRGIAVADIRPGSLLERLGLENGDVVVAIAGVRVESGSQALQALRGLDFHRGVSVDVERDGALTAIAVPAGAL